MKTALTEKQEFEIAKEAVEAQIEKAMCFDYPSQFPSVEAFIEVWRKEHPDSFLNRKEA